MGKYSGLDLPKIVTTEPTKQERITEEKNRLIAKLARPGEDPKLTSAILSQLYAAARRDKDTLKEELSEVEVTVEALKQMLIAQYEADDISSLRLADGDSVRLQLEPYTVIEAPDKFRSWCIKNGLSNSLQLPWNRANSIVKSLLLDGQPEPEGVRAYLLTKVVLSRGD